MPTARCMTAWYFGDPKLSLGPCPCRVARGELLGYIRHVLGFAFYSAVLPANLIALLPGYLFSGQARSALIPAASPALALSPQALDALHTPRDRWAGGSLESQAVPGILTASSFTIVSIFLMGTSGSMLTTISPAG